MTQHPLSRRTVLRALGVAGAAAVGSATVLRAVGASAAIPGPTTYTATWSSVDQHPPAPEWFQDAKFGIYFHWGVFSVPAFGNEWYPRNMYINGGDANNHHKSASYGDPSAWPYHNFINGAKDQAGNFVQFAPEAEVGRRQLRPRRVGAAVRRRGREVRRAGRRAPRRLLHVEQQVNEWNSVAKGPRLDLLRLHADAIRAKGLKLLVAMHHAYNFTGYYEFACRRSPTTSLRSSTASSARPRRTSSGTTSSRRSSTATSRTSCGRTSTSDAVAESQRLNFLSYYYNRAVAWNKEVVATYKDGFNSQRRGLRLRARRPGRHPDPVLAHRRQHLQLAAGATRSASATTRSSRCCTR